MKFDIISIGDATIDTFLFLHEAQVKCTIKSEECELCFPYGEKLPVQSLHRTVAGNACNNAIANARFGFKNAFVVSVGEDPSGNWIIDALKKEGINKNSFGLYPASKKDKEIFGPQKYLNCKTLDQYKNCFINFVSKKIKNKKELTEELYLINNFKVIFSKNKRFAFK